MDTIDKRMSTATLDETLSIALQHDDPDMVSGHSPVDERDALVALLKIYDLWLAPIDTLGPSARYQNHPRIAALKAELEERFLDDLERRRPAQVLPADPRAALRRIAHKADDSTYDWVASSATWEQLLTFLAIEGGPDGGFDDLVAICQVGVRGPAKVVLGANYWDEMGCGEPSDVHTVLHDRLLQALSLPAIPRTGLPEAGLARSALNGLLATNRWLQPEMIGALGLLELQAGQRCRRVIRALQRLDAPADAFPFYAEHAATDPRHGKEWLDGAVGPLVDEHPDWGQRIVRGAAWRAAADTRLFCELRRLLIERDERAYA